jgi:hypothetical protein
MATVIGLGVQFSANANGMTKGLSQVDRQLQNLGKQASQAARLFDGFASSSGAAAAAQQQVATDIAFLTSAFKTGQISSETFAETLRDITSSAQQSAAAFAEGARITEQTATAEERRVAQLDRLGDLLQQGAIDAETYGRAVASSTAGFDGTQAERFAQAIAPLREQLQSGAISLEEFNRQAGGVADAVSGSTSSAQRSAEAILELKRQLDAGAISIEEYRNQFSQIQAGNISSTLSVEVLGIREGIAASADLQAAIASLEGTQIEAALQITGVDSIDDLRQRFDGVDGRQLDALLQVLGVESIELARQQLAAIDGTEVLAQLQTAGFESIEEARSLLDSVEGKDITLLAETLGIESIEQLTAVINAVESRTVEFNVDSNADETAAQVKALVDEQAAYQQLLSEAARITQKYTSDEERRAAAIAKIEELNRAGVLSEEIYSRAIEDASGAKAEAARVDQQRAADSARAAQIIEANLSAEERASRDYAASVAELDRLVAAGVLTEADYAKAVERSAAAFAKATVAAARYEDAADGAGDAGVLKFNELSGVLAAIPGPIGNVAGRLSGLASAGEGLSRVFAGGLSQGLASIGTSVAGLVNPFTAGLAAVAAFGAGATAVARGLLDLEDRVENLGNIADKLGVSFEFIQTLEESANRSGTSIDAVSAAFGRLQKSVLGVDEESKAAQKALAEIGVTAEQLQSLSPEEQYKLIGDALSGIEDPARRTAAATALFGRAGADLLPFFRNLGPAAADIERLGGALSDIDRRRIDDFGAGLDALGVASSRLGELLLVPFAGLGEGITQGTAEFLGGINRIADAIGDILAPEMNTLGNLFQAIGAAASVAADIIATSFRLVQQVLEPIGGSILPAVGAGIAFVNRQILVGAVANLAKFFTAAAAAAVAYATSAGAATVSTAALGVAIRGAINSTGVGVLVTGFGLAAGALLEWAFSSDEAAESTNRLSEEITSATNQASAFGQEGVAALERYKQRLETIAELQDSGVFSPERAKAAADQARQGFEQTIAGFNAEAVANKFSDAVGDAATAASEFGQAGFEAAFAYQQSLQQISELLADETLTLDEAKRAAEQEKAAFEARIKLLDEEAKARERVADAAERAAEAAIQADQRRADSFIANQGLGGEDPATKAAEDLLAITRQIEEAEAAIVAARAAGDAAAEQAATRRLAILDQAEAAAQETVEFGFSSRDAARAIEEVRGRLDETFTFDNFELAPEAFAAAQEQLRQLELDLEAKVIDPDTFEEAADAIRRGFDDALRTAEQIRDLNEQYAERAAEIDAERIQALSQVSQQPLQIEDVRTGAGISEFLRLATGREDPAIAEYRKQLSELQKIAREIRELGGVVDIVGAN